MSRKYENAKIYKLVSNKTADVYIGSCLITLARRLGTHKSEDNRCCSKKMFADGAIITIVLIEALPNCKSKSEMKARELHYMTVMKCINVNRPFITETSIVDGDNTEWHKEYEQSPAGKAAYKAARKKYEASPAGKATKKKYQQTPEYKASQKKYQQTPEYKAYKQKKYAEKKLALQMDVNESPNEN
jgi:hypothetical protein